MQPNQPYAYPQPGQMPQTPQFPPSYAPNPNMPQTQATYAPPVSQPAPAMDLGFGDPSGGVTNPTARHLVGRTVVMIPKRVDENAKYNDQPRPTAYFDLYVVDGGPLMYGDSEDRANPRPFTHTIETPAFFADAMSGNVMFVNEVRSKLDSAGRPTAMALGVVQQGTRGRKPYMLTRCGKDVDGNERPDGQQRADAAQKLVFEHRSGEWTPPRATPLAQAQAPQVPQVQYGGRMPDGTAYAGYPPGQPAPTYAQPAQAAQTSAVPAPPTGYPPAPGWENNPLWGIFTPDQQSQIWQQVNAAAQANQQGAVGGVPASAGPAPSPQPATPAAGSGPGW